MRHIATEKAGIFRQDRHVVLAASIPHDARDALLFAARSLSCTVVTAGCATQDVTNDGSDDGGAATCSYSDLTNVRLPLSGVHQWTNLATAAEVLLSPPVVAHVTAAQQQSSPLPRSALSGAFALGISTLVRWPARLQPLVYMQRLILLDGSHNEEAAAALATFVDSECSKLSVGWSTPQRRAQARGLVAIATPGTANGVNHGLNSDAHVPGCGCDAGANGHSNGGTTAVNGNGAISSSARDPAPLDVVSGVRVNWIVGMLRGKNHEAYLATLLRADRGDTVACVPVVPNVSWQAGAAPDELAAIAATMIPRERVRVCASVEEAVATATSSASAARTLTVVCGSLHLCGMVLAHAQLCAGSASEDQTPLQLLETMRYRAATSDVLLFNDHVARLHAAAARFGYVFDRAEFERCVHGAISGESTRSPEADLRLRCTVSHDGDVSVKAIAMPLDAPSPLMTLPSVIDNSDDGPAVVLSLLESPAVDPVDPFLSYKTTRRRIYSDALSQRPHAAETSDVVLVNSRGEITEATIYNIAVMPADEGGWITPLLSCGLLGGVMRNHLLATGAMTEGVVTLSSLRRAKAVCVMNSVRGVQRARLVW